MVIKKVYKQKDTLVLLVDGVPVGFVRDIQGADATAEVQMEDIPAKELMDIKAAFQPLKPLVFTYKLSKDYYCGGGRKRFVKLAMGALGFQRNEAQKIARDGINRGMSYALLYELIISTGNFPAAARRAAYTTERTDGPAGHQNTRKE